MKHQPIRQNNQCLNCGATVPERYCSHCGQENIEPHESFGHLFQHFVADVVHYDSKALSTLKYLIIRPGFLTKAYTAGKRVSYVNPIKLYIFISFVFFLLYAMIISDGEQEEPRPSQQHTEAQQTDSLQRAAALKRGMHISDSILSNLSAKDSSRVGTSVEIDTEGTNTMFSNALAALSHKTPEAYDSVQQRLPAAKRDGPAKKRVIRRLLYLQLKYGSNMGHAIAETFTHNIPKLMFILLPLFALLLKWMQDKRKWLYVDHGIFSIHFHTFFFILLLIAGLLDRLLHTSAFTEWGILAGIIYLVVALRNVYGQSWRKSAVKGILLLLMYVLSMSILFLGYLLLVMAIIL
ncbi:DUF3667 domain-containing protein [Chitinophaga pendula]|uniref:DUF3667 domain-containing protein n=1 Tax=Chitinophaga TaxID=79328 RepID=UPI0012FDCCCB|nr:MULTISPECIES: DUF3667 domain-containing protein [Chitinophaga]UCJ08319.1 DUF3667 domain-containing protein [Chitinophaga pendula]